jgi:hypothetical protein
MAAIALFRGPGHVMEYRNAEQLAVAPRDGLGAPVREEFPEPKFIEIQAAMDECFVTGRTITMSRPWGWLVVLPRLRADGRILGVATWFDLAQVQPRPRPPLLPLGSLARSGR